MKRVTGIDGIFFKTKDPEGTKINSVSRWIKSLKK